MKLRLTAKGFENYTGQMGVLFFQEGLSTNDVLPSDAYRIAGVIGAHWEDGTAANIAERYIQNKNTPAPTLEQQKAMDEINTSSAVKNADEAMAQSEGVANMQNGVPAIPEQPVIPLEEGMNINIHSQESLAKIVDEKGISGLREIADTFGVKANSINALMTGILGATGEK